MSSNVVENFAKSTTQENIEQVYDQVLQHRLVAIRQIVQARHVTYNIPTAKLDMDKLSSKFITKEKLK